MEKPDVGLVVDVQHFFSFSLFFFFFFFISNANETPTVLVEEKTLSKEGRQREREEKKKETSYISLIGLRMGRRKKKRRVSFSPIKLIAAEKSRENHAEGFCVGKRSQYSVSS